MLAARCRQVIRCLRPQSCSPGCFPGPHLTRGPGLACPSVLPSGRGRWLTPLALGLVHTSSRGCSSVCSSAPWETRPCLPSHPVPILPWWLRLLTEMKKPGYLVAFGPVNSSTTDSLVRWRGTGTWRENPEACRGHSMWRLPCLREGPARLPRGPGRWAAPPRGPHCCCG